MMKHVCVAARIGDGKALDAGNSYSISKSSNAASADSGCDPYFELARRKLPLAMLDAALVKAARAAKLPLLTDSSLYPE